MSVYGSGVILYEVYREVLANPFYVLTCKDVLFRLTPQCQAMFDQLKTSLMTAPLLPYLYFGDGAEFVLEIDASSSGLGAVLSQKQQDGRLHPLAYELQAA